jgi:hypothetical protein
MAIAIGASVTVSMAADTRGMPRVIFRVRIVEVYFRWKDFGSGREEKNIVEGQTEYDIVRLHFTPPWTSIEKVAKVLVGLLLNGRGKAWFSLSSRINDTAIDHRSGRRSQARWPLIRAPHPGRVDDFL